MVARAGGAVGGVVFVRHALPGERVVVEITEGREGDRFLRGDAVEVLEASPHRVTAPCPYAGPAPAGAATSSTSSPPTSASSRPPSSGSSCPGWPASTWTWRSSRSSPVLGWRSRMQYVDLPGGARGLRKHRSHEVVRGRPLPDRRPSGGRAGCAATVSRPRAGARARPSPSTPTASGSRTCRRPRCSSTRCSRRSRPQPGESVVDLYSGVGLFAAFLADVVGPDAEVTAVEGDRRAAAHAADNLGREAVAADVQEWLECRDRARPRRPGGARPAAHRRQAACGGGHRAALAAGRRPTSPATRRRWPATSRSSPSTATDDRPARLRPVPDDAPRRMRRAAGAGLTVSCTTDDALALLDQLDEVVRTELTRYTKLEVEGHTFGYLWYRDPHDRAQADPRRAAGPGRRAAGGVRGPVHDGRLRLGRRPPRRASSATSSRSWSSRPGDRSPAPTSAATGCRLSRAARIVLSGRVRTTIGREYPASSRARVILTSRYLARAARPRLPRSRPGRQDGRWTPRSKEIPPMAQCGQLRCQGHAGRRRRRRTRSTGSARSRATASTSTACRSP